MKLKNILGRGMSLKLENDRIADSSKPITTMPCAQDSESCTTSKPKILIIEDEQDIARLIQLHLEDIDAVVAHCDRGDTGLTQASQQQWDIIILDLRLPGIGGLDICKRLRSLGNYTPIMMLTSKSSELDRVLGLEIGADDYLTKPFSPLELVARVKALLRRCAQNNTAKGQVDLNDVVTQGELTLSIKNHSVSLDGKPVDLTAKEFELLLHFLRNPSQVFRRAELLDKVWGYGHEGYEHTVNSHINRLRSKIEADPNSPTLIITVWGVGYKFVPSSSD